MPRRLNQGVAWTRGVGSTQTRGARTPPSRAGEREDRSGAHGDRARPGLIGDQLAGPGDGAIDSSP
jgi:hypothetical protein